MVSSIINYMPIMFVYYPDYSTLPKEALIGELKKLHDLAYKLGLEESKEMTRGRFLNILSARRRK